MMIMIFVAYELSEIKIVCRKTTLPDLKLGISLSTGATKLTRSVYLNI